MRAFILRWVSQPARIPRALCVFAIGPHHSRRHRVIAGMLLMGTGSFIGDVVAGWISYEVLHILCAGAGWALHGIGLTPFIEELLRAEEE